VIVSEVFMGSLARFDSHNIDNSCCGVIGTRNKNRGAISSHNC